MTYAERIEAIAQVLFTELSSRPTVLRLAREIDAACIKAFVAEVERRAEENMLKTGKLEGSHYAAMKAVANES